MLVTRLFPLCLIIALASSAPGTYYHPYGYPDIQPPISFSPHLFYGSGLTSENTDFNGFSYFTKDFSGGESDVVFFTGPNSDTKMTKEVAAMKDQMTSLPSSTITETKSDKVETPDSSATQKAEKIASPIPVETKEVVKQEEATSKTAESKTEDKKESDTTSGIIVDAQFLGEQGSGFAAPYPILRLGGGPAPYYPHQLSTSYSGFGGYEPSDYFRSQYLPVYNHYNSYQSLYNPLYPSFDTDYYNPDGFPSFYQSPLITSSPSFSPVSNFISAKPEEGVINSDGVIAPKIDKRLGGVENAAATDSDKKIEEVSTSEKAPELSTTTQQIEDKSTTVSETIPTTSVDDEIKEAATTVVSDAVAVP